MLEKHLGIAAVSGDDLLTVMFTSGSTGDPKGVMLSHDNVASQIEAIQEAVQLDDHDVAMGVLPLFHLYGYTATLWTVLTLRRRAFIILIRVTRTRLANCAQSTV